MKSRCIFFAFVFGVVLSLNVQAKCLKYGVIPYADIWEIKKSYIKWQEYLFNKTQKCIDISFEATYGDVISKFANDDLDMAFVGPFSYVLTKQNSDVEPIVKAITSDGKATYRSYLVVNQNVAKTLKIQTRLQGEQGMRTLKKKLQRHKKKWMIAFTDESSSSGYAIPSYYMSKAGIDIQNYFKGFTFVGAHDAAQLAVYNNIIPMAFSAEMLYEKLLKTKMISKQKNIVIWESDEIPKSPIIIKRDISPELKNKIKTALLEMDTKDMPAISKEIGYISTNEAEYKIIEKMNEFLKSKR